MCYKTPSVCPGFKYNCRGEQIRGAKAQKAPGNIMDRVLAEVTNCSWKPYMAPRFRIFTSPIQFHEGAILSDVPLVEMEKFTQEAIPL